MIEVHQAKEIIANNITVLPSEKVALPEALGRVLTHDITSQVDLPNFNQSAMDGYALCYPADVEAGSTFNVIGEVQAGDTSTVDLAPGEAIRIFTGAWVPNSAHTVIMQEHVIRQEDTLHIDKPVKLGANIRLQGEQLAEGDTGLTAHTQVTAAGIGFAAMMGYAQLPVVKNPEVVVLVTGNELVSPGGQLQQGQIFESNSYTIQAALLQMGITNCRLVRVPDTLDATVAAVKEALHSADFVFTSGGISVGDYDFAGEAFKQLGVETLFYKVKQKPGKPIYFGKAANCYVFGLPGNPASALTGFYEYAYPAIKQAMGFGFEELSKVTKNLTTGFEKKGQRAQFLKAFVHGNEVELLEGQSSAMMYTYAIANALIYLPSEVISVPAGSPVEVHMLP